MPERQNPSLSANKSFIINNLKSAPCNGVQWCSLRTVLVGSDSDHRYRRRSRPHPGCSGVGRVQIDSGATSEYTEHWKEPRRHDQPYLMSVWFERASW